MCDRRRNVSLMILNLDEFEYERRCSKCFAKTKVFVEIVCPKFRNKHRVLPIQKNKTMANGIDVSSRGLLSD